LSDYDEIKKYRREALTSGISIGFGIGFFYLVGFLFLFRNGIFNFTETGFLTILFAFTICGIILLAFGISFEAYKRAKIS